MWTSAYTGDGFRQAIKPYDVTLITRFSGEDTDAQEIKYNCSGLKTLYNRERIYFQSQNDQDKLAPTREVDPSSFRR